MRLKNCLNIVCQIISKIPKKNKISHKHPRQKKLEAITRHFLITYIACILQLKFIMQPVAEFRGSAGRERKSFQSKQHAINIIDNGSLQWSKNI